MAPSTHEHLHLSYATREEHVTTPFHRVFFGGGRGDYQAFRIRFLPFEKIISLPFSCTRLAYVRIIIMDDGVLLFGRRGVHVRAGKRRRQLSLIILHFRRDYGGNLRFKYVRGKYSGIFAEKWSLNVYGTCIACTLCQGNGYSSNHVLRFARELTS